MVTGNKAAARAMLDMLNEAQRDEIPMANLLRQNIEDFINGKRADVITIELANVEPGEELPGHVS
jgi:hypothetical protein